MSNDKNRVQQYASSPNKIAASSRFESPDRPRTTRTNSECPAHVQNVRHTDPGQSRTNHQVTPNASNDGASSLPGQPGQTRTNQKVSEGSTRTDRTHSYRSVRVSGPHTDDQNNDLHDGGVFKDDRTDDIHPGAMNTHGQPVGGRAEDSASDGIEWPPYFEQPPIECYLDDPSVYGIDEDDDD